MVNTAVIMGRLTADPELKVTPNNIKVCRVTVAVERNFVAKGERRQADFIDVVIWREGAEFVCKYFRKGSMIAIQGHLQTNTYEDKHGYKRKTTELIADNISFCGDKKQNEPESGSEGAEFGYVDIPESELPFN